MFINVWDGPHKPAWRPKRPLVAVPDVAVALVALYLASITTGFAQAYFVIATALFVGSALHHWLPDAVWHHRLDRAMIHLMIMATPLPEFEYIIDVGHGPVFLSLWLWGGAWMVAKLGFGQMMYRGGKPTLVYLATYLLCIASLFGVQFILPWWWFWLKWGGAALYAVQAWVYNREFLTDYRRRVLQHIILYAAFGCHAVAALWL